jgi:perosamine synthetase
MTAPFLPVAEPDLGPLEEQLVLEAVRSGWVSSIGEFINRLEREFAAFCGVEHCIALANGTVALHIALVARGIGPSDEVIVPDLTFVATAAAVRHAGATPVLVDVDPVSMCIDPELVREAITPRTKAIIPVHLFGHPAAMDALREIARERNLFLLEDAAEAHGARVGDKRVGSLGDAGAFSFYGNKLLTTGEGGCITTNDTALAKRIRFLKDHAMNPERRYDHPEVGFNYRMTNLQAAIGCAQLSRFDEMLGRKASVLKRYRDAFEGSELVLNPSLPNAKSVCWLVTALLPGEWSAERLGLLAQRLRTEHAVDTRPFFIPMHELRPYRECRWVGRGAAQSSMLASRGICLPSSNHLTDEDISRVANALRTELSRAG